MVFVFRFYLFGRSRSFFGFERADGWCESVARGFEGSPSYSERTAALLDLSASDFFVVGFCEGLIRIRRLVRVMDGNEGQIFLLKLGGTALLRPM
jgi:hypothetical protein